MLLFASILHILGIPDEVSAKAKNFLGEVPAPLTFSLATVAFYIPIGVEYLL